MKRALVCIGLFLVCLLIVSGPDLPGSVLCKSDHQPGEFSPFLALTTEYPQYPAGVETVHVTMTCTPSIEGDCYTGYHFLLEKQIHGQWYLLRMKPLTYELFAPILPFEQDIPIASIYGGRLQPGHYRILKSGTIRRESRSKVWCAAEFDIVSKEN